MDNPADLLNRGRLVVIPPTKVIPVTLAPDALSLADGEPAPPTVLYIANVGVALIVTGNNPPLVESDVLIHINEAPSVGPVAALTATPLG